MSYTSAVDVDESVVYWLLNIHVYISFKLSCSVSKMVDKTEMVFVALVLSLVSVLVAGEREDKRYVCVCVRVCVCVCFCHKTPYLFYLVSII